MNFQLRVEKKSFEKGTVDSLSFAGINLGKTSVYVEKSRQKKFKFSRQPCFKNGLWTPCEEKHEEEYGLIGMSELSKTSFEYKDGVLKICKNEEI